MTDGFALTGESSNKVITYLKSQDKSMHRNEYSVAASIPFSLFDTKGEKISAGAESGDGVITKAEFDAISKEDYEKYCQDVKVGMQKDAQLRIKELEKTKSEIRQKATDNGIKDEKIIQKMENKVTLAIAEELDIASAQPPSYEVLKNCVEKNGSMNFGALIVAEFREKLDMDLYDKNKDGIITKDENPDLYIKNGNKPLNKDAILSIELDKSNQR